MASDALVELFSIELKIGDKISLLCAYFFTHNTLSTYDDKSLQVRPFSGLITVRGIVNISVPTTVSPVPFFATTVLRVEGLQFSRANNRAQQSFLIAFDLGHIVIAGLNDRINRFF